MSEVEQKQIEEMARKIDYAINHECKPNNGESCEDCQYDNNGDWNCQSQMMATYLQGEGYRNCKDKIVLDKEEYEKGRTEREWMRQNIDEILNENKNLKEELRKVSELRAETIAETIRLAKQETTREIFDTIIKALEEKKERVKAFYGVAESVGADVAIRTIKNLPKNTDWRYKNEQNFKTKN